MQGSALNIDGVIDMTGQARITSRSAYRLTRVTGDRLSLRQPGLQLTNMKLTSAVMMDPSKIRMDLFRLTSLAARSRRVVTSRT